MLGPVPVPVPLHARCYRRRGGAGDGPAGRLRAPPLVYRASRGSRCCGQAEAGGHRHGQRCRDPRGARSGPQTGDPGPRGPPVSRGVPPARLSPGVLGGAQGAGPVRARWTLPPAAFVTRRLPVLGSNRSVPCAGGHPVNPGTPRGSRGAAVPRGPGPGRPRPCPPHSILGAHGHGGGTGRLPGGPPRAAASPPGPVLPVPALGPLLAPAARAPFLPRGARRGPGRRCRYRQPRGGGCALLISRPRPQIRARWLRGSQSGKRCPAPPHRGLSGPLLLPPRLPGAPFSAPS